MLALRDRDAEILEALLEVHVDANIRGFQRDFDSLVDNAKVQKDADIVRIVQNSRPMSIRKFYNHPLDLIK
jgi:hypothetical protein